VPLLACHYLVDRRFAAQALALTDVPLLPEDLLFDVVGTRAPKYTRGPHAFPLFDPIGEDA